MILAKTSTDDELAKLLLPETVRYQIGLIHPVAAAKLILEAYRKGYEQAQKDLKPKGRKRKKTITP